jgi:hypothetical protein
VHRLVNRKYVNKMRCVVFVVFSEMFNIVIVR